MKLLSKLMLTTLIVGVFSGSAFAAEHKVEIKGMAFSPAQLTIEVGDTIIFTNQDGAPHTGTAVDKSFDTGILNQGESGTIKFAKAGVLSFFCAVHPSMTGKLTVK